MEFPERIIVEVVPSTELERLRAEVAEAEQRSMDRFVSLRKLYIELLELCHDLKNYMEV